MLNASSTLKSAFCKNYKINSGQMLTGPWCILINQTIGLSYSKWKARWKIVKLKNFFRNYFVGRLGTKCDVSYIAEKMETHFNVETWTLDSWYFSSLAHSPKHIFLSKVDVTSLATCRLSTDDHFQCYFFWDTHLLQKQFQYFIISSKILPQRINGAQNTKF